MSKRKGLFKKPCNIDKGGCGDMFSPTSRGNALCKKCLLKIRQDLTEQRNKNKKEYREKQIKAEVIRRGLKGLVI